MRHCRPGWSSRTMDCGLTWSENERSPQFELRASNDTKVNALYCDITGDSGAPFAPRPIATRFAPSRLR
jgi:hypothetical protein